MVKASLTNILYLFEGLRLKFLRFFVFPNTRVLSRQLTNLKMISLGVLLSRRRPTLWDLQILCISMGWDSEEKMNWFVMLKMISSVFSPFPSGMPENLRHVHLEYCSIPSILFSKFVTVQRRWVIFDMRYSCMQFWIAELPRSISMHFVVPSLSLVSSSIRALSCNTLISDISSGCFRVNSFPEPFKARLTRWTNNVWSAYTARTSALNSFRVMTLTWDSYYYQIWLCSGVRLARFTRVTRVTDILVNNKFDKWVHYHSFGFFFA